jgi:hypothetical protein
MSLTNFKNRIESLERAKGTSTPVKTIRIEFVSPGGNEPLTPEETATLEAYEKKLETEPLAEGEIIKVIYWNPEKAQDRNRDV